MIYRVCLRSWRETKHGVLRRFFSFRNESSPPLLVQSEWEGLVGLAELVPVVNPKLIESTGFLALAFIFVLFG